jgi:hypothetical protein
MDFDVKQGFRETSGRCKGNQRMHVSHGEAKDVLNPFPSCVCKSDQILLEKQHNKITNKQNL